jgi:hypothetical protein
MARKRIMERRVSEGQQFSERRHAERKQKETNRAGAYLFDRCLLRRTDREMGPEKKSRKT